AVLFDPATPSFPAYLREIETGVPTFGVQLIPTAVRYGVELEHAIEAFAREPNGGVIVLPGPVTVVNRDAIIALAARHRLPAVYPLRFFALSGGLASYGVDSIDLYRRAASYVDRILKGEKPADLPVQAPTKY